MPWYSVFDMGGGVWNGKGCFEWEEVFRLGSSICSGFVSKLLWEPWIKSYIAVGVANIGPDIIGYWFWKVKFGKKLNPILTSWSVYPRD